MLLRTANCSSGLEGDVQEFGWGFTVLETAAIDVPFDRAGNLVASVAQEGLIRPTRD